MDAGTGRTHVLIVEANHAETQELATHLEGMLAWDVARSLPEAELKVTRQRPRVVMVGDGWGEAATRDFCKRLKSGPHRRELVLVTIARGDPEAIRMGWGRASGVDLQLRKPVDKKCLMDCLRLAWQLLRGNQVAEAEVPAAPAPPRAAPVPTTRAPAAQAPETTRKKGVLSFEITMDSLKKLFSGREDKPAGT